MTNGFLIFCGQPHILNGCQQVAVLSSQQRHSVSQGCSCPTPSPHRVLHCFTNAFPSLPVFRGQPHILNWMGCQVVAPGWSSLRCWRIQIWALSCLKRMRHWRILLTNGQNFRSWSSRDAAQSRSNGSSLHWALACFIYSSVRSVMLAILHVYHKTDLPSTLPCGWFFETLTSSSKFCWHGIFGWWLTYTLWYFWMMRYLHPWTKEGYVAVSIEWVLSKLLSLSPHQISVAPNLTETCDFSQKRVLNILDTKCMMRVPGCIGRPNGTHELQNMVWLNMRGGVSSGCCFHYCYC